VGLAAAGDLDGERGWLAGFVVDVHVQLGSAAGVGAGGAQPDQDRDAEYPQHVHVAGVVAAGLGAAVEYPHRCVARGELGELGEPVAGARRWVGTLLLVVAVAAGSGR
jgi:hypothetical protein